MDASSGSGKISPRYLANGGKKSSDRAVRDQDVSSRV